MITYAVVKPARPYQVLEFLTAGSRSPYREWLDGLDMTVRARIQARILRFETGNLGDHRAVGDGVCESRVDFGPGYRVYFGFEREQVVVLLGGGDKRTQKRDIRSAKGNWKNYLEVSHGKTK
jgi:putative addiction module killer protein